MKENEVKQKFIELRAEGLSYDKISKEIAVSKPTLMKWEKEFSREIKELRFIRFETLKEKYLMTKEARVKNYGELLTKAKEELKLRDLKDVSPDKLLNMINDLENKFKEEFKGVSCYSKETTGGIKLPDISKPKYSWSLDD